MAFRWTAIRSAGVDDGGVPPVLAKVTGATLEPLSPADMQLETQADDVIATWIRRSRDGFGWADFVDAPLAEWAERYQVDVVRGGRLVRQIEVIEPQFIYSAAMQAEDGGNGDIAMAVRQMSTAVGPGQPASAEIRIVQQGDIA